MAAEAREETRKDGPKSPEVPAVLELSNNKKEVILHHPLVWDIITQEQNITRLYWDDWIWYPGYLLHSYGVDDR